MEITNRMQWRTILGLLQGLILYWLCLSSTLNFFPATDYKIFEPCLMLAVFLPIVVSLSLGSLRKRTLLYWTGALFLILGGLAYYDAWRNAPLQEFHYFFASLLFFLTPIALYISHVLVTAADQDRHFQANYASYFDISWKILIQLVLSGLFLGLFWLFIWIGAGLFSMVDLPFLKNLVQKRWFSIPASALVFNLGLHITDVRAALVRGVRSLMLTLFSWLLPLLTLLVAAFLASLFFTGLSLLWKQETTTVVLVITAYLLILLINSAYQEGKPMPGFLAWTSSLAAVVLLPLTLLAIYSFCLIVKAEGLTYYSISLFAALIVLTFYTLGYSFYSFRLKGIENLNFYGSFLIVVVILCLLTPPGDPMRLAANSQIYRLQKGAITPEKFNFRFLRWETGRYGIQALQQLQQSQNSWIKERASRFLKATAPSESPIIETRILVHTRNGKLPDSFIKQDWTKNKNILYQLPDCLKQYGAGSCQAWEMDIENQKSIVLLTNVTFYIFQTVNEKSWEYKGRYALPFSCYQVLETKLKAGLSFVPPEKRLPDLQIAGQRFNLEPPSEDLCPL